MNLEKPLLRGEARVIKKQVLFGTSSEAKIEHIRAYLESLPVEVLSPRDLNIDIELNEDGQSPEENAAKKAKAYYAEAKIPTFAIDAGLRIEKFSAEKQPGVFVRRIYGITQDVTDGEILDYYRKGLEQVGGMSTGIWCIAIAFMTSMNQIRSQRILLKTVLTSRASKVLIPGAPLSSLMIDPTTGKYYSEMTYQERPDGGLIVEILKQWFELS